MFSTYWKNFKSGQFEPVYLIVGEESFFIDETIRIIKTSLTEDQAEILFFDLDEQPVDFAIDEADTLPFLSERKIIIAKNASFLKATEKGKEKVEHDFTRLESYLQQPSNTAVLFFIAPFEKLDERKKVTKLLKNHSVLLQAVTPQNKDLVSWIRSEASKYQKQMTDDAVDKIIEMVGSNMLLLRQEIEKICLYLGEDSTITVPIVEDLVAKSLEHDVFKLSTAFVEHRPKEALEIYHSLLRQKEDPIKLVGLLSSNLRAMSSVYYLNQKGYRQDEIARQLKMHPYRVKIMLSQPHRPSQQQLLQGLKNLSEIDLQLKSVGGNRERFLEMFLLKPL